MPPLTEATAKGLAQGSRHEPQVLANILPTVSQRRIAQGFAVALLVIFAVTYPFVTLRLPEISAFVPSLAAALFVADCVAAVLLFAQFSILRQWALLIIANGYLYSALIVVAHALAFPGAFEPHGLLVNGAGLQAAVWLYWIWHLGLPVSIIGYALLKDKNGAVRDVSTRLYISVSVVAVVAAVVGIYWFVTRYEDLLPITFVDVRPISFFRQIVGGVAILAIASFALGLLWLRRRSLLDEWLVVALCAFLLEVLLASVLSGARYTLGWYAGRFYQFITATVVTVVLLAEMVKIYASLARANMMLQSERDNKLTTLEAMTASISHEVRQPLAAIATRSDTALRLLGKTPFDLEKVRSNLNTIASQCSRADQVFDNIRALFGSADAEQRAIDLNDVVLGALRILQPELEERGVITRTELMTGLPLVLGHDGQMQEVILNLIQNAIEAMHAVKDGRRNLQLRTSRYGGDAIVVAIEDSGPGIPPEKLGTLFDPFVTTKPRGMGLGLAICRMTIENHGGRLSGSSGESKGALFQFILPAISPVRAASG